MSSLPRDTSAKALLDHEQLAITLPTTEFTPSHALEAKANTAYELMIRPCLRSAGYDIAVPAPVDVSEDRTWGLWSVERAREHGYHLSNGAATAFEEPDSEEYRDTRARCWDETEPERQRLTKDAPEDTESVGVGLASKANAAAKQSEEFASLHQRYEQCLKGKGYEADPELFGVADGPVADESGAPTAEEIRAAVAEATCNQELDVAQTMGNLEASYSAPMVKEHLAELNKQKEALQAFERRLDEYLRTHQ